jgi:hypothetical protein
MIKLHTLRVMCNRKPTIRPDSAIDIVDKAPSIPCVCLDEGTPHSGVEYTDFLQH